MIRLCLVFLSSAGLLIAPASGGTFSLYDVTTGNDLTTLSNFVTYDLAALGVTTPNPQLSLRYQSDTPGAASTLFRLVELSDNGGFEVLARPTCDTVAPFNLLPAPFPIPLDNIRLLASVRPSFSANCNDYFEQDNVHFRLIRPQVAEPTTTTPATTTATTTEAASTPADVTSTGLATTAAEGTATTTLRRSHPT